MEKDDDVLDFFCKNALEFFVSVNIILFVVGNWKYFYSGKHS